MRLIQDYRGVSIRLTDERLTHILEHPEMEGLAGAIDETLRHPERVIESLSDPEARLSAPASVTNGCASSSSLPGRTPLSSRPISPIGQRGEYRYGREKGEDLVRSGG